MQRYLRIPAAKIDVIYNGIDDVYRPLLADAVTTHRHLQNWPDRFILTVGTLEPRKNYPTLLDAYARYRRMTAHPLPLLIAGGKGWDYEQIFSQAEKLALEPHVHFLGFVPAETLPWLYNAAALFVYPSLYEGFGLPLAEAMACGTPAITSTASSLPEVAGDAAVTLRPDDPEVLADTMHRLLSAPEQLQEMKKRGLAQAQRFRWDLTAAQTADVYARVLEERRD